MVSAEIKCKRYFCFAVQLVTITHFLQVEQFQMNYRSVLQSNATLLFITKPSDYK